MFSGPLALTLVLGLVMHRSLDLWTVRTKVKSLASGVNDQMCPWYAASVADFSEAFDLLATGCLYAVIACLLIANALYANGHLAVTFEQPIATILGILFSAFVSVLSGHYEYLRAGAINR